MESRCLYKTYSTVNEFESQFDQDLQIKINKDPYFKRTLETFNDLKPPFSISVQKKPLLSKEALVLLEEASHDPNGNILRYSRFKGLVVKTNRKEFINDDNPEKRAIWEGAIEDLEALGFIKDLGNKREIFTVTREGFEVSSIIRRLLNQILKNPNEVDIVEIFNNPDLNKIVDTVNNFLITGKDPTASMDVRQVFKDSLSLALTPSISPKPTSTTRIVATKPVIQDVTLTTEKDGQDTILVLTLTVESNVPVDWLNDTLDGPNGNIHGGGVGIFPGQDGNPSSTEVLPNVWQVVRRDRISQYAPSGEYSYSNVSVKNAGMLESDVWSGVLKTSI